MVYEPTKRESEEKIVQKIRKGAGAGYENAFVKDLMERNRNSVARVVRMVHGTEHDLQTVLHDAALELLEVIRRGGFDPKRGGLDGLFFVIARNLWLDEIRRRYPKMRRETELDENLFYHNHHSLSPTEMNLINEEDRDRIKKALQQLDPECRELFKKKFFDGETLRTIAENANSTEDALKQKHKRCKEKLKYLLNNDPRTTE
ncbi:MAG: hypothetical protein KIPDCIKN_03036 [Haliscomenobacter sp.]|nr:hypothetical protein [Haliscomenobacter sp.]